MARDERMDWFRTGEITSSIRQAEELAASGIFNVDQTVILMSAVTQMLILLNDLLQKAKIDAGRISFSDDIPHGDESDVTDLINNMRNAACHIPSGLREFNGSRLSFNVIKGLVPNAIVINDIAIGCDYADDIAINYGGMRMYIVRHAFRALREVAAFYRARLSGQHS